MKGFRYCVVQYMPNMIAGELINIGIILHDLERGRVIGKHTKNVKEIIRRTIKEHRENTEFMMPTTFEKMDFDRKESDPNWLYEYVSRDHGIYEKFFETDVRGGIFLDNDAETIINDIYDKFITIDKL